MQVVPVGILATVTALLNDGMILRVRWNGHLARS